MYCAQLERVAAELPTNVKAKLEKIGWEKLKHPVKIEKINLFLVRTPKNGDIPMTMGNTKFKSNLSNSHSKNFTDSISSDFYGTTLF